MIPSWRKRKALERKRRDQGLPTTGGTQLWDAIEYGETLAWQSEVYGQPYRDDGYLAYCPNCGHRFDRTGHRFSCGGR
jgi:hypothetical protein